MTVEELRALLIGAADAQAEVRVVSTSIPHLGQLTIAGVKHSHVRGQEDIVYLNIKKVKE